VQWNVGKRSISCDGHADAIKTTVVHAVRLQWWVETQFVRLARARAPQNDQSATTPTAAGLTFFSDSPKAVSAWLHCPAGRTINVARTGALGETLAGNQPRWAGRPPWLCSSINLKGVSLHSAVLRRSFRGLPHGRMKLPATFPIGPVCWRGRAPGHLRGGHVQLWSPRATGLGTPGSPARQIARRDKPQNFYDKTLF